MKAVDGIDLTLRAGQTLGVVGDSGSGKTTLGLALTRMISSEGKIGFVGKDIADYSFNQMKPLRREMQIVFQDPYGSLSPRMSVAEIIAEGLTIHQPQLGAREIDDAVAGVLSEVGLDPSDPAPLPPTNFPAGSDNAWPSPGRWCWNPNSSCLMSPPPPST